MRVWGSLLALVLAISFLCISSVKVHAQVSLGHRVVESLFSSGNFSFYFDEEIAFVADSYVGKTKFAGKVRVNQPLRPDFLNIYVFKRGHGFNYANFMRNTCRAFVDVNAIICDHDLLDSIPSSMPLIFEGGRDHIPPPSLMYWIIGHEIGHLVLGHGTSAFAGLKLSVGVDAADPNSRAAARAPADQELDADLFAASGLPISNHMDWIYFGNPIVDSYFWQRDRIAPSSYEPGINASTRVRVNYDKTGHPALVERTYRFLRALERIYTSASSITRLVEDAVFEIDSTVGREYAATFYGGYYLGSHDNVLVHRQRLVDLAAQIIVSGGWPSAGIRSAICANQDDNAEKLSLFEEAILCSYDISDVEILNGCLEEVDERKLRCLALIALLDGECERNAAGMNICERLQIRSDQIVSAISSGIVLPSDIHFVSKWAFAAIFKFLERRKLLDADGLFKLVVAFAGAPGISTATKTEILLLHAATVEVDPSTEWFHLANVSAGVAEYGQRVGNDLIAMRYQGRVVELIEREMPPDALELAYHKLKLADIARSVGVHIVGSNDGLVGAMTDRQLMSDLIDQAHPARMEAGSLAESAAEIYLQSLRRLEVENSDKEAVNIRRISFVNALGSAVFSYNLSLNTDDALRVSYSLMKVIEAYPELNLVDGFEYRVLAPALENVATAHVQAPRGDAEFARSSSLRALEIRNKFNMESVLAKRISSKAYYMNRQWIESANIARDFVDEFEQKSLRFYDPASGMLVRGAVVSVKDIFYTVNHR